MNQAVASNRSDEAMKRAFKAGDAVVMTRGALENYGAEYGNRAFKVEQWYDHYTPVTRLSNHDPHGHPGYDGATGDCLYHLTGLSFDLYEWELELA